MQLGDLLSYYAKKDNPFDVTLTTPLGTINYEFQSLSKMSDNQKRLEITSFCFHNDKLNVKCSIGGVRFDF